MIGSTVSFAKRPEQNGGALQKERVDEIKNMVGSFNKAEMSVLLRTVRDEI